MYLSFYGLDEKPFATTPDPRFLYLTPGHQEALAHLVYAVQDNTAFLVLTGEVGTGKTSLLQALLNQLDGKTTVAFIVNSGLSFDGILEYMLEEFGIPTPGASRAQRLIALQRFLFERARIGQSVVLILDEAHLLDPGTLEQIRLLSNFEGPRQKHLQILLVGQPELKATLALLELRQLQQRITLRAVIPALSSQETREYIQRRLQTAGARDLDLFTERAISRIAAYTGGIPRIVNVVCEHGLLIGYADQRRRLDIDVAERAVRYLEDGAEPPKAHHGVNWRRWLSGRRFAKPGSPRTVPQRQRAPRTRSSMRSRESSRHLLRIGTRGVSLAVLVAMILFLWPSVFAGIVGWVSKVEATFRPATAPARPLGVLDGSEMRRATHTEPRPTDAPSPPAGSGSGQPPGAPQSAATTPTQIIRPQPAPGASLPGTRRAATRPEPPRPQARSEGATSFRESARSKESTRLQDGDRSQGTDAPDPSTVIDWLFNKNRRDVLRP